MTYTTVSSMVFDTVCAHTHLSTTMVVTRIHVVYVADVRPKITLAIMKTMAIAERMNIYVRWFAMIQTMIFTDCALKQWILNILIIYLIF